VYKGVFTTTNREKTKHNTNKTSKKRLYRLEAVLMDAAIVTSPAISLHGGGSTPTETANSPYRDAGVGLQLRAQV
jgi:hypothetical protein